MINLPKKFNLNFRPVDYFRDLTFEEKASTKIYGEIRQAAAVNKIKTKYYPPELVGRKFHTYLKEDEGRKHPWLLGGEELPDLYDNEIEICRIVIKSSTLDIISLRAQKIENELHFRIVDEHEINDYQLPYKISKSPLSMKEIVSNLDECIINQSTDYKEGLVKSIFCEQINDFDTFEEASKFISVHSIFYHQLENYYEEMKLNWYIQERKEIK